MTELTREDIKRFKSTGLNNNGISIGGIILDEFCELALKGLEAKNLTEQRDALLVALKNIQKRLMAAQIQPAYMTGDTMSWCDDEARAAIAIAEEK